MALTSQNTGWTDLTAADDFLPHSDINDGVHHSEDSFAQVADAVADLPASGNWPGRNIWVAATKCFYAWNGTAWQMVSGMRFHGHVGTAVAGTAPTAGTPLLVQTINTTATPAANGIATISFANPFPTGVLTIQVENGDQAARPHVGVQPIPGGSNVNGFQAYCFDTVSGSASGSSSTRFIGLAIGW